MFSQEIIDNSSGHWDRVYNAAVFVEKVLDDIESPSDKILRDAALASDEYEDIDYIHLCNFVFLVEAAGYANILSRHWHTLKFEDRHPWKDGYPVMDIK